MQGDQQSLVNKGNLGWLLVQHKSRAGMLNLLLEFKGPCPGKAGAEANLASVLTSRHSCLRVARVYSQGGPACLLNPSCFVASSPSVRLNRKCPEFGTQVSLTGYFRAAEEWRRGALVKLVGKIFWLNWVWRLSPIASLDYRFPLRAACWWTSGTGLN